MSRFKSIAWNLSYFGPQQILIRRKNTRTGNKVVRVEVEAEGSGNGGRGKQQGSRTVNFLKTKKPLFVLGRTDNDDVVERAEKVTCAETDKADLLLAGFDKGGRGKVAGRQLRGLLSLKTG